MSGIKGIAIVFLLTFSTFAFALETTPYYACAEKYEIANNECKEIYGDANYGYVGEKEVANSENPQGWGFFDNFFKPMQGMMDSMSKPMTEMFSKALEAMMKLSDDIGKMADRILDMADKIGDMADRIVATEKLMAQFVQNMSGQQGSLDTDMPGNCKDLAGSDENAIVITSPAENDTITKTAAPKITISNSASSYLLIASNSSTFPRGKTASVFVKSAADLDAAWTRLTAISEDGTLYLAVKTVDEQTNVISRISNSVKVTVN